MTIILAILDCIWDKNFEVLYCGTIALDIMLILTLFSN